MTLDVTKDKEAYLFTFKYDDGTTRKTLFTKDTYELIKNHFIPKTDSADDTGFNELWKLHSKGNKKTAKQRYTKAIKKVSFTELKSILEIYIKSNDFCYLKGLDVWLNPEKEHWNDPIVNKIDKFKQDDVQKISFF